MCGRCAASRWCSRSAWSDRILVSPVTYLVCFARHFISTQSFADDALERHVFLDGQLAAIVVFGRNVQDALIHGRNFDRYVAKTVGSPDGFARSRPPLPPV